LLKPVTFKVDIEEEVMFPHPPRHLFKNTEEEQKINDNNGMKRKRVNFSFADLKNPDFREY